MARTTPAATGSRSRGALTGLVMLLLGIWGGLIPFVGPYFHYGFAPDATWHFSWERIYLNVVPGGAAVLGGAILILAATQPVAALGGLLGVAAGAWFAVGVPLSTIWQGSGRFGIGPPLGGHVHQALEWVGVFYGLGVIVVLVAGLALGRIRPFAVRDTRHVEHQPEGDRGVTAAEREPYREREGLGPPARR